MAHRYFNCMFPETEGTVVLYDTNVKQYLIQHPGVGFISYQPELPYADAIDCCNSKDFDKLDSIVPPVLASYVMEGHIREVSREVSDALVTLMCYRYRNIFTFLENMLIVEVGDEFATFPEYVTAYTRSWETRITLAVRYLILELHLPIEAVLVDLPKHLRDRVMHIMERYHQVHLTLDFFEYGNPGCAAPTIYCEMRYFYEHLLEKVKSDKGTPTDIKQLSSTKAMLQAIEKRLPFYDGFYTVKRLFPLEADTGT